MDWIAFIEKNILFLIMNLALILSTFSHSFYDGLICIIMLALLYNYTFDLSSKSKQSLADLDCLDLLSLKLDNLFSKIRRFILEEKVKRNREVEKAKTTVQDAQFETHDSDSSTTTYKQNSTSHQKFNLLKKGKILNYILFAVGAVPLIAVLYSLNNYLGLDFATSSYSLFILLPILLFNGLYYLPTLICYSPSKIFIFILNILVSWTLIGWVILLFYANSSNRSYRYQEEMLHYQRNGNK